MPIIGIDYGDKRIGIAKSDLTCTLAGAICTIEADGMRLAVEKTAGKLTELGAELVVIGMPRNMDGTEGFRAQRTREFAERLSEKCSLPVEFMDERLTTSQAYTYMNESGFNGSHKRKKVIDALSAQIILQSWIDSRKNKL